MAKLVDLSKVEKIEDLPDFRLPKWLKPNMIQDLMNGEDSESDDDIVHVDIKKKEEKRDGD